MDNRTNRTKAESPLTFTQACKAYFGLQPAQAMIDFAKEVRELSPADREEITKGLEQAGYYIVASPFSAA